MSQAANTHVGRHRAETVAEIEVDRVVPDDIRAALVRAVEAADQTYNAADWSFEMSSILGWVADRVTDTTSEQVLLALSSDCRTAWVSPDEDVEEVLAQLAADTPMGRSQIEWLLGDEYRFSRGSWNLEPVEDLGWICSRQNRLRRPHHFVVARNQKVAKVATTSRADAKPVLVALMSQPESSVEPTEVDQRLGGF